MTFVGEGAVDYGGPKKEFFRLLALEAAESFFSFFLGTGSVKFFSMNATFFQASLY